MILNNNNNNNNTLEVKKPLLSNYPNLTIENKEIGGGKVACQTPSNPFTLLFEEN